MDSYVTPKMLVEVFVNSCRQLHHIMEIEGGRVLTMTTINFSVVLFRDKRYLDEEIRDERFNEDEPGLIVKFCPERMALFGFGTLQISEEIKKDFEEVSVEGWEQKYAI